MKTIYLVKEPDNEDGYASPLVRAFSSERKARAAIALHPKTESGKVLVIEPICVDVAPPRFPKGKHLFHVYLTRKDRAWSKTDCELDASYPTTLVKHVALDTDPHDSHHSYYPWLHILSVWAVDKGAAEAKAKAWFWRLGLGATKKPAVKA